MQPVKNKTTQLLVLTGPGAETCVIAPNRTGDVPDVIWANMKGRKSIQSLVDSRGIIVIHGATTDSEPKTEESDWSKIHWKKAQKLISKETDTETLHELLEGEERPKFKKMLSTRIEELKAA